MDASRSQSIKDEIKKSEGSGGDRYNYVDVTKLTRLGISGYQTKKGNNFIRIVTSKPTGFYGLEVWKHSDIGVDNRTFVCTEKMFKKPCPICELYKQIKAKNPEDERLNTLYPSRRYFFYVVDTKNEETQAEGVKWFDCPISIKTNVVSLSMNKRNPNDVIDVSDPVDGRDIEFVRVDGAKTSYEGFNLVATGPIPEGWYKDLPDYVEMLNIPSYEKIKLEVTGMAEESKPETQKTEVVDEPARGGFGRAATRGENVKEEVVEEPKKEVAKAESNVRGGIQQIPVSNVRAPVGEGQGNGNSVQARLAEIRAKRTA